MTAPISSTAASTSAMSISRRSVSAFSISWALRRAVTSFRCSSMKSVLSAVAATAARSRSMAQRMQAFSG